MTIFTKLGSIQLKKKHETLIQAFVRGFDNSQRDQLKNMGGFSS